MNEDAIESVAKDILKGVRELEGVDLPPWSKLSTEGKNNFRDIARSVASAGQSDERTSEAYGPGSHVDAGKGPH
jgi:hypothetical protein